MDDIEKLFLEYKQRVFNFALRILCNRADAEDVTGEVFLMLYTKTASYEPSETGAKFSTWLFTVVRNTAISKLRKRKKFFPFFESGPAEGKSEIPEIPDPKELPDRQAEKQETALLVQRAIQKLPLGQREAILLREYHEMSYEEIGQILKCSLENVKILEKGKQAGFTGSTRSGSRP